MAGCNRLPSEAREHLYVERSKATIACSQLQYVILPANKYGRLSYQWCTETTSAGSSGLHKSTVVLRTAYGRNGWRLQQKDARPNRWGRWLSVLRCMYTCIQTRPAFLLRTPRFENQILTKNHQKTISLPAPFINQTQISKFIFACCVFLRTQLLVVEQPTITYGIVSISHSYQSITTVNKASVCHPKNDVVWFVVVSQQGSDSPHRTNNHQIVTAIVFCTFFAPRKATKYR